MMNTSTYDLKIEHLSKSFGVIKALDNVSLTLKAGTFHALLGENGAGKSTIAKCIMGYYKADAGKILFGNEEVAVSNPREAHKLGIGMVYQHFMLVDNMTVAENMILARGHIPFFINWKKEKAELEKFMKNMPFQLNLQSFVRNLAAGEKQKLEIVKQLYLNCKILFLDEPTSVLTPGEADDVLGFLSQLVKEGKLTILMITHKFREVFKYADTVSVLRKGNYIGGGPTAGFTKRDLAEMMIGSFQKERNLQRKQTENSEVKLRLTNVYALDEMDLPVVSNLSLHVKKGEIYGIAGVSGNGQKRLVEILAGQKKIESGKILVDGKEFLPKRKEMRQKSFHCLPEEPLKNACIPDMSVAENLALRYFDQAPYGKAGIIKEKFIREKAEALIKQFNVKTPTPETPIKALSGGNVQRAVLARELSSHVEVLVISNPCFGLDFNAIDDIRSLIMEVRNRGAAILLLSEDLEEIIELSDRIGVIFNGQIVFEADAESATMTIIGEKMAGH
jgi:general nucleoside transport system ATP-binding protein